jgi:capsular polysaccharide export protein
MTHAHSFLFLQGVNTPFFARLADQLAANGNRVFRVNFSVGDAVYWGHRPAWPFRKPLAMLSEFLRDKILRENITDIVLFGDRRPIHRPAIDLGKALGLRIHVFEEGYLRPYWVTLERDGVNANSLMPRDSAWYKEAATRVPDSHSEKPFAATLRVRALHDMTYHSFNVWNLFFYPRYRTHRPYISAVEYMGWGRRFSLMPWYVRRDRAAIEALLAGSRPYYLLPLQLDSDTQIREHSPFQNMADVIKLTAQSFARHAPADARLVIKNHPLDTGFVDYRRLIRRLEVQLDIKGRIEYLESGDLDSLLTKARGLVTVNSTTGISSLARGCPTIALSDPLYNLTGLTFKGTLDEFWRDPVPPDSMLFKSFRKVLMHATQVNGGFYSADGIALAVANSARVLTAARSPLEGLL